ncbi:TonB-dependent receptor [Pseudoxanthomonas gei]|uniref:TonB-dependent receptor n=1 Tax=Pseudoxanthomonas gei TaxID=1383030 RepID=A0ABX0AKR6_9GAMM|nr:TonB-dependent receptor [Pseudoxanthomonas gei]NDK39833.1 TonB-dependent receptor [Pseudoxanthomonas gei]
MKHVHAVPKKRILTSALLLAMANPLYAQVVTDEGKNPTTTAAAEADAATLDTVVVTGIRGSLTSSMNLKRDAQGIVDGIVAEDIGKFPDTNLAESLQRISGVSIDRSMGEGSKVTVRGVGPDFNLVLLNGRQMPASSNAGGAGVSNSRAFDFANLASESISGVEVYKTSRAQTPPGGIGATINIKTARPLESAPTISVGMKAVNDTSNGNLPSSLQGEDFTGEMSGIFSQTYADGKFGVALSGSFQKRDFGYSQVSVPNGWRPFRGDENNWGTIPQPGSPGSENIINRPGPTDIYSVPQNLNYSVNGVQRERTNGQITLQWAPTDRVTATLDYTYSENKIQQQRNELSVWFNYGPSSSSWTDGPVAAPIVYSEALTFNGNGDPNYSDVSMGGMKLANVNENKSLGFNVEWEVNDRLDLAFDYHDSSAETRPDSPYGSAGVLGASAFVRATTTADFSRDFPVLTITLPPGVAQVAPSQALVSGSVFQNAYTRSEIEQGQISGRFELGDYSGLDFGVSSTEVNNRTAYGFMQRDTWGGVGTPADYADDIWTPDNMGRYFDAFSGSNSPNFTDTFLLFDFDRLRDRAAELTGRDDWYRAPAAFSRDLRTTEKSQGAYLQWNNSWQWSMPFNLAVGVRYEKTEITSSALVPTANAISWGAANELNLVFGDPAFATLKGEYDHWLPNIDMSLELTDSMILRGSYGRTIGRPGWADIQGGQTLDQIVRVDGGTGAAGDPALEPLVSDNFDLSFEWYYGESSYFSVGYFRKNIDNYIGTTQIVDVGGSDGETPFDLHTPVGGAYWNAALAGGCPTADVVCIRNYIFSNFNGQPGVTAGPLDSTGNFTGTIVGQPGDPLANFRINTPANTGSSTLDGFEINLQHVFGESGFGLAANYTIVDSPNLNYDNYVIGDQFALIGLSDSANFVGFYDKGAWQIRAAYNWRDEFLSGRFDGIGPNPNYTEAYGQFDLSIGYKVNDQFSIQFEGINLTDETQRIHGRNKNQLLFATQTGPRYMLGFRYKFE